jgi:hypothetical protein
LETHSLDTENKICHACFSAAFPGKSDEQRAAAAVASVLCIQLGPGFESEEILKTLGPILKKIICDGAASIQARQTVSMRLKFTGRFRLNTQAISSRILLVPYSPVLKQ